MRNKTKGVTMNKLKYKDYVGLALRTESIKKPLNEEVNSLGLNSRLLHAIMGIKTEIDEFKEAIDKNDEVNALEEIGDMFWYSAIIADELDIVDELNELFNSKPLIDVSPVDDVEKLFIKSFDNAKKTLFYGKEFNRKELLSDVKDLILVLAEYCGEIKYNVLAVNIAKLQARYPNKFEYDKAVIRDLDKEREILEKGLRG